MPPLINRAVTVESAPFMLFRSEKQLGEFRDDQWILNLHEVKPSKKAAILTPSCLRSSTEQ